MMTSPGSIFTFNMNDGFLEAILRGYQIGLISQSDYQNLTQCEKLEDMKLHLQQTSYGNEFLANEPLPLHSTTIADKCIQRMVDQFNYLRTNSVNPLSQFLDYITYGYMIDNIILLITGTIRDSNSEELKAKCHPLGFFKRSYENDSIIISQNVTDLYHEVLIDTPLGPYIQGCLSEKDLDEMHVELIRNTLYKAYLEDFHKYCTETLGGVTGEVMHKLLQFEADKRCINITLNSFGTELTSDDRQKLYPTIGLLYPEGTEALMVAENEDAVKHAVSHFPQYAKLFEIIEFDEDKSLEDAFFEYEVKLNMESFETQFGYGCFYSYFRLKEQEIRNLLWIAECILQDQKNEINRYIVIK